MSNAISPSNVLHAEASCAVRWKKYPASSPSLPRAITKAASPHSFYTVRLLVDRGRVHDAFRAYAYFRWVDDSLDSGTLSEAERLAFIQRQQRLIACSYRGEVVPNLCAEEQLLADVIHADPALDSGLALYIHNLLWVMVFDAHRRGRVISEVELTEYSYRLAAAVTESLHYFIGHNADSPHDETRYLAVVGAHITHMLRDTYDDLAAGYFNVPAELLDRHGLTPHDVSSEPYVEWVKSRVAQARDCFAVGRRYLDRVGSRRCRLAGYAYMARFEHVLDCIEADGYQLRPSYPELKYRTLVWYAIRQAV